MKITEYTPPCSIKIRKLLMNVIANVENYEQYLFDEIVRIAFDNKIMYDKLFKFSNMTNDLNITKKEYSLPCLNNVKKIINEAKSGIYDKDELYDLLEIDKLANQNFKLHELLTKHLNISKTFIFLFSDK